jgi:hypothetical protein
MSPSKLLPLANLHPLATADAPSTAVTQPWQVRPMEHEQPSTHSKERSPHKDRGMEEPLSRPANVWVPVILFVLPPCIIIALIIAFPKHTFGVLGTSILSLWGFTSCTVRVPLLREKMGISSIMAVHGHYFCYCILYGIIIYGDDDSWLGKY